ncbi:MAG: hypothetical protein ACYCZA_08510 [Thiobacillus sp.]
MPVAKANATDAKVCMDFSAANVPGRLRCHDSMALSEKYWVDISDSQIHSGFRRR